MSDTDAGWPEPSWDAAPCGLIELDRRGIVVAANSHFFERSGLDRDRVINKQTWTQLLSAGARMFWETQLAPVLLLEGTLREVMLDLVGGDGGPLPVLVSARRELPNATQPGRTRLALMTVTDRRAYEDELRRRFSREHADSLTLQNALMTEAPHNPTLDIVTRYRPAADGARVGGDWYDSFVLPDSTITVAIGDVLGHDMRAAAAMGQLRGIIRTIGYTAAARPSVILSRADQTAAGLQVSVLASAILAHFEPKVGGQPGQHTLQWSNAGHPSPILISRSGEIEVLERLPSDTLLGYAPNTLRTDHVVAVFPGDTLILYTDGLIERRDESLHDGIARLAHTLRDGHLSTLEELCESLLSRLVVGRPDDVALLAARVRPL
jgi:hypothetical protein